MTEGGMPDGFLAKGWYGGSKTAPAYGLKVSVADRNTYFKREWGQVLLHLAGRDEPVVVNTDKDSFWNDTCRELVKGEIGRWLKEAGKAPWPKGSPPTVRLTPLRDNAFRGELAT